MTYNETHFRDAYLNDSRVRRGNAPLQISGSMMNNQSGTAGNSTRLFSKRDEFFYYFNMNGGLLWIINKLLRQTSAKL